MRGYRGLGPNPISATNQLCDLGPEGEGTIGKAEGTIGKLTLDLFLLAGARLPGLNPTSATPN